VKFGYAVVKFSYAVVKFCYVAEEFCYATEEFGYAAGELSWSVSLNGVKCGCLVWLAVDCADNDRTFVNKIVECFVYV